MGKQVRMFERLLQEAIEGLPDSHDPYEPGAQRISPAEPGLGDIDSNVDLGSTVEKDDPNEVDQQDINQKMAEPEKGEQIEPPLLPVASAWKPFPLPNKKDIGLRRSDGFILRMRKLESVPNKWLAQVFVGDKVLEKGQVIVPPGIDDAVSYIKDMTDYILDGLSERDVQEQPLAPDVDAEPVVSGLEKDTESEDLGELGLFDDNFEMQD